MTDISATPWPEQSAIEQSKEGNHSKTTTLGKISHWWGGDARALIDKMNNNPS
jgi:hypothetical protein